MDLIRISPLQTLTDLSDIGMTHYGEPTGLVTTSYTNATNGTNCVTIGNGGCVSLNTALNVGNILCFDMQVATGTIAGPTTIFGQLTLISNATNITLRNGNGTSSVSIPNDAAWHNYQFVCTSIAKPACTIAVYVDSKQVASSFQGADTYDGTERNSQIGCTSGTVSVRNLIFGNLMNSDGTRSVGYLNNPVITRMNPVSQSTAQLTGSDGGTSNNHVFMSERTETTWVQGQSALLTDTYTMGPNPPSTGQVTAYKMFFDCTTDIQSSTKPLQVTTVLSNGSNINQSFSSIVTSPVAAIVQPVNVTPSNMDSISLQLSTDWV